MSIPFIAVLMMPVLGNAPLLRAQSTPEAAKYAQKGVNYAQQGRLTAAETELRKAAELAPRDPEILSTLGGVLGMPRGRSSRL